MNTNTKHWSAHRRADYEYFKRKLISISREKTLIDLGAGPTQFADIFLSFKKYIGVDFEQYEHVSIITDLTKDIPIPDNSADIITLSNVVEHIPNTEHLFLECKRLLKPEGLLIGTVPWMTPLHQEPYDFNRYTPYQITKFLEEAGFSDITVEPLGNVLDAYNTFELKTFDYLRQVKGGIVLEIVRFIRRLNIRLLRFIYRSVPTTKKFTETYGFSARINHE